MKHGRRDLDADLRELTEDAQRLAEPIHPEDILAYVEGELSPEEEAAFQDRLVLDPDAARAVLDLEDPSRLDDAATDFVPSWGSVRAAMETGTETGTETAPEPAFERPRRFFGHPGDRVHPGYRWATAALFVTTVVLLAWIVRLERSSMPSPFAEPSINSFPAALSPADSGTIRDGVSDGGVEEIVIEPGIPWQLILQLGDRGDFAEYAVEFRTAEGEVLWRQDGFLPDTLGTFGALIPADYLAPGLYKVSLLGSDEGETEYLVETYRLRLRPPDP